LSAVRAWALVAILCLWAPAGGAVQESAVPAAAAYADSDYAPFRAAGDGAISGRVAYGRHAANGEVYLDPVTPHSRAALEGLWREESGVLNLNQLYWPEPPGSAVPPVQSNSRPPALLRLDPRALKVRKVATAGKHGEFQFSGLPPGEYYIWTRVTWARETGGYYSSTLHTAPEGTPTYVPRKQTAQGVWMHRRIRVAPGDRLHVTITR
jgi:hypothetical protein